MAISLLNILLRTTVYAPLTTANREIQWNEEDQNFIIIYEHLRDLEAAGAGNFTAYDNGTTYSSVAPDYVSYGGNIWQYINAVPQSGVTPGTDPLTWGIVSLGAFAHERNKDQYLDFGGSFQVSAEDLYNLVSATGYLTQGTNTLTEDLAFVGDFVGIGTETSLDAALTIFSNSNKGLKMRSVNLDRFHIYVDKTTEDVIFDTINAGLFFKRSGSNVMMFNSSNTVFYKNIYAGAALNGGLILDKGNQSNRLMFYVSDGTGGRASDEGYLDLNNSSFHIRTGGGYTKSFDFLDTGNFIINNGDLIVSGKSGLSGITSPTAYIHTAAGTSAAGTAPEKNTSGTLLTVPEAGAKEYNNSFYQTKNSLLRYGLGGTIFDAFADAGNTTTSETDLHTYTTPTNTLEANGDKIKSEYGGIFVSSGTATRQLKIYFAGTAIFDSGTLLISTSAAWNVQVLIIRVSSTVVRYTICLNTQGAALAAYTSTGELTGLTLSNANVLKITGQAAGVGAATNDIVLKLATGDWKPVAAN